MDRVYYYGADVLPHATHPARLLGGEPPVVLRATGGVDQFGGRLRPPGIRPGAAARKWRLSPALSQRRPTQGHLVLGRYRQKQFQNPNFNL
jgi:hypothetical protein